MELFQEVFQFVLSIADRKRLVSGQTVGVNSTTLEANAAMKSIVRRDTGEDRRPYVTRLMRKEGVIEHHDEPTDEDVRRYDRQRNNTRVSNEDWVSETDGNSRIAQMKDGRTHLTYKAEHVVDLDTDLILSAQFLSADRGDTQTMVDSVMQAELNLQEAGCPQQIEEVVADKGYHAAGTLELADSLALRTYIPEPRRNHDSRWTDKPEGYQPAVYANRRRVRRSKSKSLQKKRSEYCERTFAYICVRAACVAVG